MYRKKCLKEKLEKEEVHRKYRYGMECLEAVESSQPIADQQN